MPDFDGFFFSLLECKRRQSRSPGKRKNGNIKRKTCAVKRINTRVVPVNFGLVL